MKRLESLAAAVKRTDLPDFIQSIQALNNRAMIARAVAKSIGLNTRLQRMPS